MFEVNTEDSIYQIEFCHLQVNITSSCNMRCEHCRGDYSGRTNLSLKDFNAVLDFAENNVQENAPFLISGGEPLLHPNFKEIMVLLKERGFAFVSITTNGSFLTPELLDFLDQLNFKNLRVSISLDSLYREDHNKFRNNPRAYDDAINAIKLVSKYPRIMGIVRATIKKNQLSQVPEIVDLVYSLGANVFSVSSIIPVGRAKGNKSLEFDAKSKKKLIQTIEGLKDKYPSLIMDVNDPLRCLIKKPREDWPDNVFGGCIAGIGSFSVEPDGVLLPCPLMHNQIITNICGKNGEEILTTYSSSKVIHNLLKRNLKGKCKNCKLKNVCGGCRARAESFTGDYLDSDPECFYGP